MQSTMKRLFYALLLCLTAMVAKAQMADPVHFSQSMNMTGDDAAEILFNAKIDPGWHVYSTNLPEGGPIAASLTVNKMDGAKLDGKLSFRGKEIAKYDDLFGMDVRYFENQVTFVQKIKFTKPDYDIDCSLEYGSCNDQTCMPPAEANFKQQGKSPIKEAKEEEKEEEKVEETASTDTLPTADTAVVVAQPVDSAQLSKLWTPVIDELKSFDKSSQNTSLLYIFLSGLLGGLLALFTPCVWPIIPMTVSFFLKRNKDRKKGIRDAITYGLSIVVIYVALGLAVTLLFGASALNALSTNAVFNIFFFLLLVVFAASFFGAFELTLPSSWSNKIDQKSEATTGLLSIFLMAFTLALVSFSCTGPIIGFLLVAVSTQGNILAPTVGMLGFAIALAIPFALFALFPTLLKSAPKSGGWMNVIKVTLGFIELAFALKFLSVADLAYGWHLLDRETFIALWIAIFGLLGAYLLGWIKFPHDDEDRRTNVPQFFLALLSIAFTVYMIPGLWGAPLKAISAFTPPMSTQDFNLDRGNVVEAQFTDYESAMAVAKAQHKPVMIDFTGFGCVNCRKMEAAVWTDPRVATMLRDKYVLVSLYVDDKTPLPSPIEITENGQQRTLKTVGDKWSYLQRQKFGANTQPFYVLIDNDGKPLNASRSYDEDITEFLRFLETGVENYKVEK